jgi:hypothetical protein
MARVNGDVTVPIHTDTAISHRAMKLVRNTAGVASGDF